MAEILADGPIKVSVTGARGESASDALRRLGSAAGAIILPTDTDQQVFDKAFAPAAADRAAAENAADLAQLAAVTAPNVYVTEADGLASVTEGKTFWVQGDDAPELYRKVSGAAVLVGSLLTGAVLARPEGSAGIGTADGITLQESISARRAVSIPFDEFRVYDGIEIDDVATMEAIIAYCNANGTVNALAGTAFTIDLPARLIDLYDGVSVGIHVSNVTFRGSKGTTLLVKNGTIFTLGATGQPIVENIAFTSFHVLCPFDQTPDTAQCFIRPVNVARVEADFVTVTRVRRFLDCEIEDGCIVSSIYIRNCRGVGMPENRLFNIDNNGTGVGADFLLDHCNFVPVANPSNPHIVPVAITTITKANPAIVGALGHTFETGDRVRIRDVVGMTQVNGNDYTVTKIDANNFSLDGVNSTSFSNYTSGGFAVERHFGWQYDNRVLRISGQWDTIYVIGGSYLHWNTVVELRATRTISYLFFWHFNCDLICSSLVNLNVVGASIAGVWISDGWSWIYDGPLIRLGRTGTGSVVGLDAGIFTIGILGEGVVEDPSAILSRPDFYDIKIQGAKRIASGTCYLFNFSGLNDQVSLHRIRMSDPQLNYAETAGQSLIADVGFTNFSGATGVEITDCYFRVSTQHYPVNLSGSGIRVLSGNVCHDGSLPEYLDAFDAGTASTSPIVWKNDLGMPCQISVLGSPSTVTSVNIVQSNGPVEMAQAPGTFQIGREQEVQVYWNTTKPVLRVLPVNS